MMRLLRAWRSAACWLLNGGHELYRAGSPDRVYQQCVLCGYQTRGWDLTYQPVRK